VFPEACSGNSTFFMLSPSSTSYLYTSWDYMLIGPTL
jgi:hypothetical protein